MKIYLKNSWLSYIECIKFLNVWECVYKTGGGFVVKIYSFVSSTTGEHNDDDVLFNDKVDFGKWFLIVLFRKFNSPFKSM